MNKKDSKGSGIILVIVALSFLGIIAGALLTAAAYAYRLKVVDYNSKDNFHFVEQAMDEVYAGLGTRTSNAMVEAYSTVVDEMVYFDTTKKTYVNIGSDVANQRFKDYFMNGIKNDTAYRSLAQFSKLCESFISNDSVKVISDNMVIEFWDEDRMKNPGLYSAEECVRIRITAGSDGKTTTDNFTLGKIVVKNVRLQRTANYSRSSASGSFTQTVSADYEIVRPEFDVNFNTIDANKSSLFDYCLVGDSGVEINQVKSSAISISGNIYGGADFYDKDYNLYGVTDSDTKDNYTQSQTISSVTDLSGKTTDVKVKMQPVTNRTTNDLYNARLAGLVTGNTDGILDSSEKTATVDATFVNNAQYAYNGYNANSRYSGLFINGAKVNIRAKNIVVPGTFAILNGADVSVYNSNGTTVSKAAVWADNVVLDGYTVPGGTSGSDTTIGSSALFVANLHVKDDLEVDSDYSKVELVGSYYGFGNGTQVNRKFIPLTATDKVNGHNDDRLGIDIYDQGESPATSSERAHYKSSAIIMNGEHSSIDLSQANKLFVAGQAYIELSAEHKDMVIAGNEIRYAAGDTSQVVKDVVSYDSRVEDYKTGESVAVKSNQLIYIPTGAGTYEEKTDANGTYYTIKLNSTLLTRDSSNYNLFEAFFSNTDAVPCKGIKPAGSNRMYYFFDFDRIFAEDNKSYDSADEMAAAYAQAYMDELQKSSSAASTNFSPIRQYLDEGVINEEQFKAGTIIKPDENLSNEVYTSGALTSIVSTSSGNDYDIYLQKDATISSPTEGASDTIKTSSVANAMSIANDITKHYDYVRFTLDDAAEGSAEADFVNSLVTSATYGRSSISPINRYFDMPNWEVKPNGTPSDEHVLQLSSGYKVWMSQQDIVLDASDCVVENGLKTLRGIVVTKGAVYFNGVENFEGLIVAGDKIYVGNGVKSISANPEMCRAIITELQTEKDPDAEKVLRAFNGFSTVYDDLTVDQLKKACDDKGIAYDSSDSKEVLITKLLSYDKNGDDTVKDINTIDYSDVVKYSNWMKNVE